jgi:hypothetical protein
MIRAYLLSLSVIAALFALTARAPGLKGPALQNPLGLPPGCPHTGIVIRATERGSIWKSWHLTPITTRPGANGQGAEQCFGPLSWNGVDAVVGAATQLNGWNWTFVRWMQAGEVAEFPIPRPPTEAEQVTNHQPALSPYLRAGFFQFVPEWQFCCLPTRVQSTP